MKINLGAGGNTNNKCSLRLKTLIKFISTRKDRGRINNHYVQSSMVVAGGCDFEKIRPSKDLHHDRNNHQHNSSFSFFFISPKPSEAINILKSKIMVFEKLWWPCRSDSSVRRIIFLYETKIGWYLQFVWLFFWCTM